METKLLYQDDYVNIVFEEQNNLLIDTWNNDSENLSVQKFKDLIFIFKEMVEKSNAANVLTDVSLFMFTMTPELQEWSLNTIIIPLTKETDYAKHAFVMPSDFIANLAIEQFTEETNTNAVATKYFTEIEEAKEWLLKKELVQNV